MAGASSSRPRAQTRLCGPRGQAGRQTERVSEREREPSHATPMTYCEILTVARAMYHRLICNWIGPGPSARMWERRCAARPSNVFTRSSLPLCYARYYLSWFLPSARLNCAFISFRVRHLLAVILAECKERGFGFLLWRSDFLNKLKIYYCTLFYIYIII